MVKCELTILPPPKKGEIPQFLGISLTLSFLRDRMQISQLIQISQ